MHRFRAWFSTGILCAIGISIYSFHIVVSEWDSSPHLSKSAPLHAYTNVIWAFAALCTVITAITYISARFVQQLEHDQCFGDKSLAYQFWLAILFARACHVWTEAISNQTIVTACKRPLTIWASDNINWTCVDSCDGVIIEQTHHLPFFTGDSLFKNASSGCAPWFEENTEALRWTMAWECAIFAGFMVHLILILATRTQSYLNVIDVCAGLGTSCIAFVPQTYYSTYNIVGIVRFAGLLHAIIPLEARARTDKMSAVLMLLKLLFITFTGAAILFVAEKPCHALYDTCDDGFRHFGDTLYFMFVTLSTVGYGDMSPKTEMGKVSVVFIILASISYLPHIISDAIERCKVNRIHHRLDAMHEDIRQVGFFMHAGTLKKTVEMTPLIEHRN